MRGYVISTFKACRYIAAVPLVSALLFGQAAAQSTHPDFSGFWEPKYTGGSGAFIDVFGKVDRAAPPHSGSTAFINARIVDPTADTEYVGAVLISDGKIADFGPNLFASGAPYGIQSVDCRGFYLAPGLVDARVHTGEPGEEHKETLESAGIAAAAGGITSLVLLPDNEPPFDDASLIEFVARRARQIKLTNMYAYGALTVGLADHPDIVL